MVDGDLAVSAAAPAGAAVNNVKQQSQKKKNINKSKNCSIFWLGGGRRGWIGLIFLVGLLVLAMSMLVQQMVWVHSHDSFWSDFHADWKLADFAQERHHHEVAEDTNYTWINNQEVNEESRRKNRRISSSTTIKKNDTAAHGEEHEQEEITSTTASNSNMSNHWRTILASAGVPVSAEQEMLLPALANDWKELFGLEPIILGMETVRCLLLLLLLLLSQLRFLNGACGGLVFTAPFFRRLVGKKLLISPSKLFSFLFHALRCCWLLLLLVGGNLLCYF
jgi:hypothetical protein